MIIALLSIIVAALLLLNYQFYITMIKPKQEEKRLNMLKILEDFENIQRGKAIEDFKSRNPKL